jgi:transposase
MINRTELTDDEWTCLYEILLLISCVYEKSVKKTRRFLNPVLWVLRIGGQWRLLPDSFEKWNSVFKRFSRGCKNGIWQKLHEGCIQHPDLQHILIDSAIARAHAGAAGAVGSHAESEALGRSKVGFSCKIHTITDGLGNQVTLFKLNPCWN